jgi:AcrR family transcriptional regulator
MPKPRFLKLDTDQQRNILEVAAREFAESGYEAASYNRIIADSGISKGAMYYYFEDKTDLYQTVMAGQFEGLAAALGGEAPDPTAPTFWDDLRASYGRALGWLRAHPQAVPLFVQAAHARDAQGAPLALGEVWAHLSEPLRRRLDEGRSAGLVRDDVPHGLLLEVLEAVASACAPWLTEGLKDQDVAQEERLRVLVDLFERVLADKTAHAALTPPAPVAATPAPSAEPAPVAATPAPVAATPAPSTEPAPVAATPAASATKLTPTLRLLRPFGDELWIADGPTVRFYGMPLPTRMTVVRLPDDQLWLHSPVQASPELLREVSLLGTIRHLVAPNHFHHLALKPWISAHPMATLHIAPGLKRKRPDLTAHTRLTDAPDPAWASELDQHLFQGSSLMEEAVFFHRRSRTLILTDLIMNLDAQWLPLSWAWFARVDRILAPSGEVPRTFRATIRKPEAARQSLARLRAWQPERLLMAHGVPVERGAVAFLDRAFRWLAP